MTNKRKIEILEGVLKLYSNGMFGGICIKLSSNKHKEYQEIRKYLRSQRPNIMSKFWWNPNFSKTGKIGGYWWNHTEGGYDQRKKFLQHLINKLKNETTIN